MVIGHCIVLSVSQASHEGIYCKETSQDVHCISFDIACFFSNLVVDCICKFLGLGHDGSIYFAHIS